MHLSATSGAKSSFIGTLRPAIDTVHGLFPFFPASLLCESRSFPGNLIFERLALSLLAVACADYWPVQGFLPRTAIL